MAKIIVFSVGSHTLATVELIDSKRNEWTSQNKKNLVRDLKKRFLSSSGGNDIQVSFYEKTDLYTSYKDSEEIHIEE